MKTETVIAYLKERYRPLTIITYGSYVDGSNNPDSDFDSLLIIEEGKRQHDVTVVDGIQLDVFIYPRSAIETEFDCSEFVQIFDGDIILDTDNIGSELKTRVLSFLSNLPAKSKNEISEEVAWCKKMAYRAQREDTEAFFRWHWLLVDSLEIVCDMYHQPYLGPKKSLKWMKENHHDLFEVYSVALERMDKEALQDWVNCLSNAASMKEIAT